MDERHHIPDQRLLVLQIICGALVAGVAIFAVVTTLVLGALQQPASGQIISLLAAGLAMVSFVMHLVVPNQLVQRELRDASRKDIDSLLGLYQTQMIVGLALLEGAAFFNLVALLLEHNWWSLAIAGCLVLWMLMRFPTRTRVSHWIETRQLQWS